MTHTPGEIATIHVSARRQEQSDYLALGEIAEKVNASLRDGRELDVSALVAEHPEQAEQIRHLVPALAALHQLGQKPGDSATAVARELPVAGQIGDYRILREIGRGGMGVVYLADQVSLGRRVALKVLPFAAVLDQKRLRRFQNEAQAAAQLHHQNIVPVYSVGCERGVHYYAMQYVEGQSLAEAIAQLRDRSSEQGPITEAWLAPPNQLSSPQSPRAGDSDTLAAAGLSTERSTRTRSFHRAVASLGVQAAEALEHAHAAGVLHRDIKPSNLLLDVRGNLWITDFGLARIENDAGLTMTGDLLGTIRYMSPEQALAKRILVDHRTDIYSLGVTLYELLTLRPAVDGQDRQEILRRIAFEEPRPPRRLNGSLPSELEIIVLKAMAKNPVERYASAQELADDLNRFLEDRPILAKRPNVLQRISKWTRRHKIMVQTMLVTLIVALGAGGAAVRHQWLEAVRQRNLAQANYHRARDAVDRFFTQVSESRNLKAHGLERLRLELLTEAQEFYKQFLEEPGIDKELPAEHGHTLVRLAVISNELGDKHEAARMGHQAMEIFESLARSDPNVVNHQRHMATAHATLAAIYFDIGRTDLANTHYNSARATCESLAVRHRNNPEYQLDLARSLLRSASLNDHVGRSELAEREYRRCLALLESLARTEREPAEFELDLAKTHEQVGERFRQLGRTVEAEKSLLEAVAILDAQARLQPDGSEPQFILAKCQINLGGLHWATGNVTDAEAAFRKALSTLEIIVRVHPDLPESLRLLSVCQTTLASLYHFMLDDAQRGNTLNDQARETLQTLARMRAIWPEDRFALSKYHQSLGLAHLSAERAVEAERSFQNALPILQILAENHPEVPKYRHSLGRAWLHLGNAFQMRAQNQDARAALETALDVLQSVAADHPQILMHRRDLATCHNNLGVLLTQIGDAANAEQAHDRARQLREELARDHPAIAEHRRELAQSHSNLAELYRRTGRPELAEQFLISDVSILDRLVHDCGNVSAYQVSFAQSVVSLANMYSASGQWQKAEAEYRKAIDVRRTLAQMYPDRREYANALASVLHNFGWLYTSTARYTEAEQAFRESLDIKQQIADADPDLPAYQHSLALTLNTLGWSYANLHKTTEAESAYQRALAIRETLSDQFPAMLENTIDHAGLRCNMGHLYRDTLRYEQALESYGKSIGMLQAALAQQPMHSECKRYLRNAHKGSAEVLGLLGQHEQAMDSWDRTIELETGPSLPWFRLQRALALARLDRYTEAIGAVNELPSSMHEYSYNLYTLACVFARSSGAVRRDERPSQPERDQLSEQYAARAIELLRQAHAAGHFRTAAAVEQLTTDRDLEPVRGRRDFEDLLNRIRSD